METFMYILVGILFFALGVMLAFAQAKRKQIGKFTEREKKLKVEMDSINQDIENTEQ